MHPSNNCGWEYISILYTIISFRFLQPTQAYIDIKLTTPSIIGVQFFTQLEEQKIAHQGGVGTDPDPTLKIKPDPGLKKKPGPT